MPWVKIVKKKGLHFSFIANKKRVNSYMHY